MTPDPRDRRALHQKRGRLLVVSMYYAPERSGNAPYVTELSNHLASTGWEVLVIAGVPHYPDWRRFAADRTRLRSRDRIGDAHVHRFRHYVPAKPTALRRLFYEMTFYINARAFRIPQVDGVLAIVPSLSDAALAGPLAKRAGCGYGLMFQDVMSRASTESGVPGGHLASAFVRSVECRAIRSAAAVGIATEGFRDFVEGCGAHPKDTVTVPNWSHLPPPNTSRGAIRTQLGWSSKTVVMHGGNMGYKQGLEHVVAGASVAADLHPQMLFVFVGAGSRKDHLVEQARGLHNVEFLDPQSSDRYADLLSAADVLLVHEAPGVSQMSLPSKLTSYFSAGRPVVAAVDPRGITAAELQRSEAAVSVAPGDPDLLVETIAQAIASPDEARERTERGRRYARENLSREASMRSAELLIERITQHRSGGGLGAA